MDLEDADVTDKDFGNKLTSYSISGKKFNDLNNDGVNDGEPGLAGWTIQLSRDGNVLNTTTTGPDGSYKFDESGRRQLHTERWLCSPAGPGPRPRMVAITVELKDADATGKDFGAITVRGPSPEPSSTTSNGNGLKDEDESGPGRVEHSAQPGTAA